jgi:glutathione S-transferase
MELLTYENEVFRAYVIAATLMILLAVLTSWITVFRMMNAKGGFRAPEDLKQTPLNPQPNATQTEPNEYVERVRRIQANHGENLPYFLIAGLLFVLTGPDTQFALWLLYGYVASRLFHFGAYITAQIHDIRATFWTIGSLIIIVMAVSSLWKTTAF